MTETGEQEKTLKGKHQPNALTLHPEALLNIKIKADNSVAQFQ